MSPFTDETRANLEAVAKRALATFKRTRESDKPGAFAALTQERDALRACIDVFLSKYEPRIGAKSGRADYGRFVSEEDLWALHVARLAALPPVEPK